MLKQLASGIPPAEVRAVLYSPQVVTAKRHTTLTAD